MVPLDKMTHFDKMAALVHKSFNELSASISENFSGRKVIAGLVMKMADHDIGTVISIGTGFCLLALKSLSTSSLQCCEDSGLMGQDSYLLYDLLMSMRF